MIEDKFDLFEAFLPNRKWRIFLAFNEGNYRWVKEIDNEISRNDFMFTEFSKYETFHGRMLYKSYNDKDKEVKNVNITPSVVLRS